jgi:hypothetical protein
MIDQQSFVNVSNHLNVVEYFRPYFVILLLDAILFNTTQTIFSFFSCLFIYLHRLMEQIHDRQVHDQLLYMCYKLSKKKIQIENQENVWYLLGILQVVQKYLSVSFL